MDLNHICSRPFGRVKISTTLAKFTTSAQSILHSFVHICFQTFSSVKISASSGSSLLLQPSCRLLLLPFTFYSFQFCACQSCSSLIVKVILSPLPAGHHRHHHHHHLTVDHHGLHHHHYDDDNQDGSPPPRHPISAGQRPLPTTQAAG